MQYNITPAQVGTRPSVDLPNPKLLEILGEEGIRKLISDHYDLLKQSNIRGLFPPSEKGFEMAKQHSADFFIQILGGPKYFNENRGAPMMAARHSPFKINQEARRIWLEAYAILLTNLEAEQEIKDSFWKYIDIFSIWMMNSTEN